MSNSDNINYEELMGKADEFAARKHKGQFTKEGKEYIFHPRTVASFVNDPMEKVVALLHDTVEDTDTTVDEIRAMFGNDVAECVGLLTRPEDMDYQDYIARLTASGNVHAMHVKMADLTHNSNPSRLGDKANEPENLARMEKYKKAKASIQAALVRIFHTSCLDSFHDEAKKSGYAKNGVRLVQDLSETGSRIILRFLEDDFFRQEFSQDPQTYYYVIMALTLQAGMVVADQWHEAPEKLDEEYILHIIQYGPAEAAEKIWKERFNTSVQQANDLYAKIYNCWLRMMSSHWSEKDPRDYIFNALFAAFDLGVSIMLDDMQK